MPESASWRGVCSRWGGVCSRGICSPQGGGVSAPGECVCSQGGIPACTEADPLPPVNRMTDTSKNITLPTTSLRPVKIGGLPMKCLLKQKFYCSTILTQQSRNSQNLRCIWQKIQSSPDSNFWWLLLFVYAPVFTPSLIPWSNLVCLLTQIFLNSKIPLDLRVVRVIPVYSERLERAARNWFN